MRRRATPTRTTSTPTTRTRTSIRKTRASEATGGALARCLDPVAAEEFLAEAWERKPLVVRRSEPGRFDDLLSTADVERLVCSSGLRHPAFRLVKEGARFDVSDYTVDVPWRPAAFTATIDAERVLAEFDAGATIVLQGLHLTWAPLAAFCRDLEARLGHPVQANAYFTPRDSQGLAVHHDTHDVFVLQCAGEKRWLVYEPAFELPLKNQRYSRRMGEPGEPVHDVVLRPGDTLYMPRGWLHEAVTSATDSLHVTVGVNVYTWADALRAALRDAEADVELRRAVPDDGEGGEGLVELLRTRLVPAEVARRKRARFVRTRRPILEGQLTQLRALDDLGLETLVERRRSAIADLELAGGSARVAFAGKVLIFPARVHDELAFVLEGDEPFRPADLPGELDDEGRLVLVRRLVREGLLAISEPRAPSPASDGDAAARRRRT